VAGIREFIVTEVLDASAFIGAVFYAVVFAAAAWALGWLVNVEFDLLEGAKKRFQEEGIEIPFPYWNVVVKER